ncbi:MAG: peptidoglycan-associated lipoprotein Pal [Zoogloeaceae bacterium]|jgi:peptidoglycan-associated lipoprotein|nr:peptidoglycan-associated lipoprotein Pal [Zoogloeaceae bacterium]
MKKFASFAILTLLLALAGCGTTKEPETGGAPVENRDPNSSVTRVETSGPSGANLPAILTSGVLAQRSVYFALDRYDVAEDYRGLLAAHANFLVENRNFKVLIQGNTDERGSHEYNLSLGQKRAEAVKRILLLLGVREDQVEAVSLGEEKPRAEGHDESAWAQNRRADILYSGEY